MATITVTKKGISAQISGNTVSSANFGYYADGNPWVLLTSGSATIDSYSPSKTTVSVGGTPKSINGAMKNPRGHARNSGNTAWQGLDQRADSLYPYTSTLDETCPISAVANDVIVIAKSDPLPVPNHSNRPGYITGLSTTRSHILEMMAITFVSTRPAKGDFRPGAFGPSSQTRLAFNVSQIQWGNLPAIFNRTTTNTPTYEYLTLAFSDFCGEMMTQWNTDGITPDLQHPGYGQYLSGLVSQALCKIMEINISLDEQKKRRLVQCLIQWGIDLWSAFRDGRITYALGGHMQGRKALIIFAGHMLGNSAMSDPDSALTVNQAGLNPAYGAFQEKHAYFSRSGTTPAIWYGGKWAHGYNSDYVSLTDTYPNRDYVTNSPSTWTSNQKTQFSYWGDENVGAQIGTALAMLALKRSNEWSQSAIGFITQCMQGFNNTIAAEFTTHALDLNGTTIVNGNRIMSSNSSTANSYCADLWRAYRFTEYFAVNNIYKYFGVVQPVGPFLTCNSALNWGSTVVLEIYNAPTSGISTTDLYFGDTASTPTTSGGATIYVSSTSLFGGIVTISNPNSFGILLYSAALPSVQLGEELNLTIQIVFNMSDGTKISTNAISVIIN